MRTAALLLVTLLGMAESAAAQAPTLVRGRQVHAWFVAGDLDALWAARSPEASPGGYLRDRSTLAEHQADYVARFGAEAAVVAETTTPFQGNVHYARTTRHAGLSETVRTVWILDGQGLVVGFTFDGPARPAPRSASRDEDLTPYCAMAGAGLCTFLVIFAVLLVVYRMVKRGERAAGQAWARAAAQLGLSLGEWRPEMRSDLDKLRGAEGPEHPTTAQAMQGHFQGRPVEVRVRMQRGSQTSPNPGDRMPTYWTDATARLAAPLLAGASIRARGTLARLAGAADVGSAYEVKATDEAYATALVSVPGVAESLMGIFQTRGLRATVRDETVTVTLDGMVTDEPSLRNALHHACHLAASIDAARASLPAPALVTALDASWGPLAAERGWTYARGEGRMTGRILDLAFELRVAAARGWQTGITVTLAAPAGLGLRLFREGALSGVARLVGMQDVTVGDPRFDGRFVVQGQPEAAVRALLGPAVRDALVAIQEQAAVLEVFDDRVVATVTHAMTDPAAIDSALTQLAFVAGELSKRPPAEGPYRG